MEPFLFNKERWGGMLEKEKKEKREKEQRVQEQTRGDVEV